MKQLLFAACLLCGTMLVQAQKDYKVVFDLTSKSPDAHNTAIRQVTEITEAEPDAQVEVVLYSQSVDMVTKGKSTVADEVARLVAKKNVSFKVCAVTMKRKGLTKDDLLPGVGMVPDGIYEIISKQREGWGYIKIAQ